MVNSSLYARGRIIILLFPFIMVMWAFSTVFGLEVTVQQKAVVKGETIRLGDIAGFDPVDDSRVSQLKEIEISSSPSPGSSSTISKNLIIYKTNAYISGDKDILVRMPEKLTVQRSAQIVSARRMEEIYREYIRDNSTWAEDEIGFEGINTPETVALPEGGLTWDVQDRGKKDFIGNVTLVIGFSVDGRPVKKVSVSGKVSVRREIIRATGKIGRGQIITAQDIEQVNEAGLHYRKDSIISREDVIGKRALRTIQEGQTILDSMVENPPPVKKGDRVIISAESSELKITTSGEALQDGKTGDQVEVLNIQSGRKILATVKGSGIVEVLF